MGRGAGSYLDVQCNMISFMTNHDSMSLNKVVYDKWGALVEKHPSFIYDSVLNVICLLFFFFFFFFFTGEDYFHVF